MFISTHGLFYETTFPFSTQQNSYGSPVQLFKLQHLPKILHTILDQYSHVNTSSEDVPLPIAPEPPTLPALDSSPTSPQVHIPTVPICTHPMVTRNQDGTRRTKVFLATGHPIPTCFMIELASQLKEPQSYKHALKDPLWK